MKIGLARGIATCAVVAAAVIAACGGERSSRDSSSHSPEGQIAGSGPARPAGALTDWLADMRQKMSAVPRTFESDPARAQQIVLDVYINRQEYVEIYYGEQGRVSRGGELGEAVMTAEKMFHNLMPIVGAGARDDTSRVRRMVDSLDAQLVSVERIAVRSGVPLIPPDSADESAPVARDDDVNLSAMLARVDSARVSYAAGNAVEARHLLERGYLQDFEPLEPLIEMATVARVEELVHMRLRPRLVPGPERGNVDSLFGVLRAELQDADESVRAGRSAWFGAVSAFVLIVREGLEAILLLAAMIAYLSRADEVRMHRKHVYTGAAAGLAATAGTWLVARTLIPIDGGHRELLEGITALVAVAVLLYVSHWIFRRTYMGEWKRFLQDKVNQAVTAGSGLAIAGLAFAAVYREGFETVLFYQALLVDLPGSSVGLGFTAGAIVIAGLAYAIITAGLRLPLKVVFRATNAVLLFLSVAILGKGLYNLQEAGLFNPHPLEWLPNSELLRQVLGFYPMAETLFAQLGLVTLVVVMYVIYRRRRESMLERAAA